MTAQVVRDGLHAATGMVAYNEPSGLRGRGTAFTLGGNLMATAAHVVGTNRSTVQVVITQPDANGYQDSSPTKQYRFIEAKVAEIDPVHDLAILELQNANATATHTRSNTDRVESGQQLVSAGFPHADTGRCVLTQKIVDVGAKVLIPNQGQKVKHIVVNTLLRKGESGGPVFARSGGRLEVVAILTGVYVPPNSAGLIDLGGVDPQTLHQTTQAVSAEYLWAML